MFLSSLTHWTSKVEEFSQMKRAKILSSYGDMRKAMGLEIKTMWFNLGQVSLPFLQLSFTLFSLLKVGPFFTRKYICLYVWPDYKCKSLLDKICRIVAPFKSSYF